MRGISKRVVALHAAAVCVTLSGMFTTWAGAVRWQHCWGSLGPCRTMGDEFYEGAYTGGTPPTGIHEPLLVSAVLLVVAVLLLAVCGRRPLLGAAATALSLAGVVAVQAMDGTVHTGPMTPWDVAQAVLGGAWLFGGLFVLGALGWLSVRATDDRLARVAWSGVVGIGATTNIYTIYVLPQLWADSWDDPTWMWNVDGTLKVLAGLALVWAAGRLAQAGTEVDPPARDSLGTEGGEAGHPRADDVSPGNQGYHADKGSGAVPAPREDESVSGSGTPRRGR